MHVHRRARWCDPKLTTALTDCGRRSTKRLPSNRPIQPHLDHAEFRAALVQISTVSCRLSAARTHEHDHVFRVGRAGRIQTVCRSGQPALVQIVVTCTARCPGRRRKMGAGFARLERVPGFAPCGPAPRMVGRHCPRAMFGRQLVVNQRARKSAFGSASRILLHLVERVRNPWNPPKRNPQPRPGRLRNRREVRRFLHAGRPEAAAGHDVGDRRKMKNCRGRSDRAVTWKPLAAARPRV